MGLNDFNNYEDVSQDANKDLPTKIMVIGVGGGGGNAINYLISTGSIDGVQYMAVNTDKQDLQRSKATIRLQIGAKSTKGQGAGAMPEVGRKAAEENIKYIEQCIEHVDMVVLTAGMGGGTGTGAAPVIAKLAKQKGKLTIAFVTKPFDFEGNQRMEFAESGIEELRRNADSIIVINNDRLFEFDEDFNNEEAFNIVDTVLQRGITGLVDLIAKPQKINRDYADVKTVMTSKGFAHMAIGSGKGDKSVRMKDAVYEAVNSPLLETTIEGATHVLVNVICGRDISLREVREGVDLVKEVVHENALVLFGMDTRPNMESDEVLVTLIATGFNRPENENFISSNQQVANSNNLNILGQNRTVQNSSHAVQPSLRIDNNAQGFGHTQGLQSQQSNNINNINNRNFNNNPINSSSHGIPTSGTMLVDLNNKQPVRPTAQHNLSNNTIQPQANPQQLQGAYNNNPRALNSQSIPTQQMPIQQGGSFRPAPNSPQQVQNYGVRPPQQGVQHHEQFVTPQQGHQFTRPFNTQQGVVPNQQSLNQRQQPIPQPNYGIRPTQQGNVPLNEIQRAPSRVQPETVNNNNNNGNNGNH